MMARNASASLQRAAERAPSPSGDLSFNGYALARSLEVISTEQNQARNRQPSTACWFAPCSAKPAGHSADKEFAATAPPSRMQSISPSSASAQWVLKNT